MGKSIRPPTVLLAFDGPGCHWPGEVTQPPSPRGLTVASPRIETVPPRHPPRSSNRQDHLRPPLPSQPGKVLEIASGTSRDDQARKDAYLMDAEVFNTPVR